MLYGISFCFTFYQTQIRETEENMKRKAKELNQQRRAAMNSGGMKGGGFGGGFGSNVSSRDAPVAEITNPEPPKPSYKAPRYIHYFRVP